MSSLIQRCGKPPRCGGAAGRLFVRCLLALLAALTLPAAQASDLSLQVWQHIDPAGRLSAEEAKQLPESAWAPHADHAPSLGYTSASAWFRVRMRNTGQKHAGSVLEISNPMLSEIVAHRPADSGDGVEPLRLGASLPFSQRVIAHRNFVLPVELQPGQLQEWMLEVRSETSLRVPMRLLKRPDFFAREQRDMLMQGAYVGVVLAMLGYNLFILLALRERVYLWYLCWIASIAAFVMSMTGMGFQWLWPESPWITTTVLPLSLALAFAFAGQLHSALVDLPRHWPAGARVTRCSVVVAVTVAALSLILPYRVTILLTLGLAVILMVLFMGVAFGAVRRALPTAPLFLASFAPIVLSGLLLAFTKFGWLPAIDLADHGPQIGSAIEMMLLSLALGARIQNERRLREQAQQAMHQQQAHANQVLEARVAERTNELARLNVELQTMSRTDPLTGLANRRLLHDRLDDFIARCRRSGMDLAVLMIDVDHFKQFNDRHGHAAGDHCLQAVAQRLADTVRQGDDLIVRYGGEEFCVLSVGTNAEAFAERLRRSVHEARISHAGQSFAVTVSIGMATGPITDVAGFERLLQQADEALYAAKAAGRNCWQRAGVMAAAEPA